MPAVPHLRLLAPAGATRHFQQRRVLIAAGAAYAYEANEWSRALVVVESGRLELRWSGGARLDFEPGDTLCLGGLGLSALCSPGPVPTLLLVLRPLRPDASCGQTWTNERS